MRGDFLHYCIFKGINSNMLDLYMERCPEKVSPKRRDENIEISGRHGTLTSTDGTYDTYIRQAEFTILNVLTLKVQAGLHSMTNLRENTEQESAIR